MLINLEKNLIKFRRMDPTRMNETFFLPTSVNNDSPRGSLINWYFTVCELSWFGDDEDIDVAINGSGELESRVIKDGNRDGITSSKIK